MTNDRENEWLQSRAATREDPKACSCSCWADGEGKGAFFEIRVKGHLGSAWSDWFDGLDLELLDNGETVLSGYIVDQAALMGILNKLNRLNLALLSVCQAGGRGR